MGRYPFKTAIGMYMGATRGCYSLSTEKCRRDILMRTEREFSRMREADPTLLADPRKWTQREVLAIVQNMRDRGLSPASIQTELVALGRLLIFLGNPVLDTTRARMPSIFPRQIRKRGACLTEDQLEKVFLSTEGLKGWRGEYARFLIAAYAYTGLRLTELVRADRQDLDEAKWTICVAHPKGERTYGEKRTVAVPEPLRPVVERYLDARRRVLAQRGLDETKPLVFPEKNPYKHLSRDTVQKLNGQLKRVSGVDFTIHGLRRTYGQMLLNRGASVEAVSIAMGHSSTAVTERHYCRKDADLARREINRAFERPASEPSPNSTKIDRRENLPGYA